MYEAACAQCERRVMVPNALVLAVVVGALEYDKRSKGSKGRALTRDLPALGLLLGDRVEPSPDLPDVGALERISTPAWVLFWRPDDQTLANHRNPLLAATGVRIRSLALDTLHTLHLGGVQGLLRCSVVNNIVIVVQRVVGGGF